MDPSMIIITKIAKWWTYREDYTVCHDLLMGTNTNQIKMLIHDIITRDVNETVRQQFVYIYLI